MTDYSPYFEVGEQPFETALKHGMELYWDGSTPTKRLDQRDGRSGFTRYVNARVEGKLAEVAFTKMLARDYDIEAAVDWRIYGDYDETDDGDFHYMVGDDGEHYPPQTEFDIKKTKPWNSWLAIRTEIFDKHPEDAPFVLTKLVLEDDLIVDEWSDTDSWPDVEDDARFQRRYEDYVDDNLPVDVQIVGTAYPDEFTDHFDQGDKLYHPDSGDEIGGPLRRDNKGIAVQNLKCSVDRWNRVVSEIVGDAPISYSPL